MKNTTIFKRLLGYLKAYRLRLFFVLLSAVISTAFMVLAPFLVGKVTTTLFASISDKVFYWETIIWLLAALVALYFVSQLFSFLQGFGMAKITANVMQTIRREIDEKMHRLKLNYYDVHTHGDILSVITNDVDTINNTISQNLTSIGYDCHRRTYYDADDQPEAVFDPDCYGASFSIERRRSDESERKVLWRTAGASR